MTFGSLFRSWRRSLQPQGLEQQVYPVLFTPLATEQLATQRRLALQFFQAVAQVQRDRALEIHEVRL